MGPVSFEKVEAGSERATAMALAAELAKAGIRVMSVHHDSTPGGTERYWLVVRSHELAAVKAVMAQYNP